MAKFETFDRDLKLATASIAPEVISAELAKLAKSELVAAIERGEASPVFTRYVDGVDGATEETVDVLSTKTPGPILYVFSWWKPIIEFALADLIKRSPKRSGRFAQSFIVIVRDRLVSDYSTIRADDEVIITNAQPYVRKVQVGAMEMSVPPQIFDAARSAVVKEFGAGKNGFGFAVRFLDIAAGVHPLIPYVLKGEYAGRFNAQRARLRAGQSLRTGEKRLQRRKDRDVGQPITYPALVLNMTVH
jgi:hypothetical protein